MNRVLGLSALASLSLLAACSEKKTLQELEPLFLASRSYATVEAQFCMADPSLFRQRVKYTFILDKSSSNFAGGVDAGGNPISAGTDPTGSRRYSRLVSFLNSMINQPPSNAQDYFYSLINFSSIATTEVPFTNDPSVLLRDVQADFNNGNPVDGGDTNYLEAIQAARGLILRDLQALQQNGIPTDIKTRYVVVFITDGAPVVEGRRQTDIEVLNEISLPVNAAGASQTLMGLKSSTYAAWIDDIVLNTGLYFNEVPIDPDAAPLLQQMAAAGGGDFIQFGGGQVIDFALFAAPPRNIRYQFVDAFVENGSANWFYTPERQVEFLLDADGDGLPSVTEAQFGSNPAERDTDGNGVSDYVEYVIAGRPCRDGACAATDPARSMYATCSGLLSFIPSPNQRVTFGDSDRDGVNDCEELLLKGDRFNFDSNGDNIPDFLSLKANVPFISGLVSSNADPDLDQLSNYQELKLNTPNFMTNARVPNLRLPSTVVRKLPVASNDSTEVDCYQLRAENVAVLGWDNLIRIHVVQNLAISENQPILRTAEGVLGQRSKSITFSRGDFR